MKVYVEFASVEIEIDEQTFDEYQDRDPIAIEELKQEVKEVLNGDIPNIAYVREIRKY